MDTNTDTCKMQACEFLTHYHLPCEDLYIGLVGSIVPLGEWNPKQAVVARDLGRGWKYVKTYIPKEKRILFKWVILNKDREPVRWEEGANKRLELPKSKDSCQVMALWNCVPEIIDETDLRIKFDITEDISAGRESSEDNGADQQFRFVDREEDTYIEIPRHLYQIKDSWKRKLTVGIGVACGILTGSAGIYMALAWPEPEPEPTVQEIVYDALSQMAGYVMEGVASWMTGLV